MGSLVEDRREVEGASWALFALRKKRHGWQNNGRIINPCPLKK